MKVLGYCDPLGGAPGDRVQFMVNCASEFYQADIVRLPHHTPTVVPGVAGVYPGRKQAIRLGSYVDVPDHPALGIDGSFTIAAFIFPTTPRKGVQGIVTKWSPDKVAGFGLVVDDSGSIAVWLGGPGGQREVQSTGAPLRPETWYFVAAAFDASRARIRIHQRPLVSWPADESLAIVDRPSEVTTIQPSSSPLLIAAGSISPDRDVTGYFNGKIEAPCLFDTALDDVQIESLAQDARPDRIGPGTLVAAWNLGGDMSSDRVLDLGPREIHGQIVNMPTRAVTGHSWKARVTNFKDAPAEYAAIHFHDDDLEDAGWQSDFSLTIPDGLPSGVYAARLRVGDGTGPGHEDHVPFFVRPPAGTATAPILFLAPTASYMAYANLRMFADPLVRTTWASLLGQECFPFPETPEDHYVVENRLLSLYDHHSDGSGVCYSSRRRPMLDMRPGYSFSLLGMGAGAPHQFSADLQLLEWMDAQGFAYDVATDEDLHREGEALLARYRVVVTGTHHEYWSAPMLESLEAYVHGGGRVMHMGANGFYWVISFDPRRPHVMEVRRCHGTGPWDNKPGETHHSTTGEPGGTWRHRGRSPQKTAGAGFTSQGFDHSRPYRRLPDSHNPRARFIFEGVGDGPIGDYGSVMGGAGGFEVDRADPALGTPSHALVLATCDGFSDIYQLAAEESLGIDPRRGGSTSPLVRGDMVYFETAKNGAMFSVGSIAWCGALSHNGFDNDVSRITRNVLAHFVSSPTLP